jgi:hypothetical protein
MRGLLVMCVSAVGITVHAQGFSQRGFFEMSGNIYPQIVPDDSAHGIGETRLRYEPKWQAKTWLTLDASLEARLDTHHQDARSVHIDWNDRSLQRPALSVRQLSAVLKRDNLTFSAGKQFIRWGETDFLNPTDRFAPKDLLTIVDQDVLPVTAARLTYTLGNNALNLVWQPFFTPGRIPLVNQRWTFVPEAFSGFDVLGVGSKFPGRSSFGARWSRSSQGYEWSLSYYDGFNYLPSFNTTIDPTLGRITFSRSYPALRLYGGDLAISLPLFTLKGEAAYYTSPANQQDEYVLYVLEAERQIRELQLVFGYTGEVVTAHAGTQQFLGERGFTRAAFGHARYALDANRTLTLDVFVRQNGRAAILTPGYSHSFGNHWRASVTFTWLSGDPRDFLGRYYRNSFATTGLHYSF